MAKTLKPYEVPLDPDLAEEILNIPLRPGSDHPSPTTIGERVKEAMRTVEEANDYLATSKLAALIADTIMRRLKKRGVPSILVRPDGTVVLHVSYQDVPEPRGEPPVERQSRSSDLPKLDELRRRAEKTGVDISDLGRQRRAIYERVLAAEEAAEEEDEEDEEDVHPPVRLIDEVREGPAPPDKKPGKKGSGSLPEEIDIAEILGGDGP